MITEFIKKYFLPILIVPHVSGAIGMFIPATRDFFMNLTPLMLVVTFVVIFLEEFEWTSKNILALILIFIGGYSAEFLGVNYGILFGDYTYGTVLGFKIFGVPLTIAMNWAMLCVATRSLINRYTQNVWLSALSSAALITVYDIVLEPVAIKFDWWWWEDVDVPLYNYVCWFAFTFIFQLFFRNFPVKTGRSYVILFVHLIFYLVLLMA